MPQRKTPRDAKASKTKPARAKSKSAKPRGKASALGEAVDAASQAIYSPGDASVSASASTRSRRRGSPDVPPDDRPNPRFVHRDRSPGSPSDLEHCSSPGAVSHDEGDAPSHKGASEDVSSVHGDLSGDGDNVPKSPADTGSTNASAAGGQMDGDAKAASPAKRLTLGEGLQRARDAKAKEAASKKRIASRSPPKGRTRGLDVIKSLFDSSESNSEDEEGQVHVPEEVANALDEQQERLQEARMRQRLSPPAPQPTPGGGASGERESKHPRGYFPPDENTGSPLFLERLGAPRGLIGGPTSRGAYERDLIQKVDLFTEDIEAARCVLLAPHRMPLKEFTTLRKKGENRGGLHPVWGYPWVQPENTYTVAQAEDLFWRWVGLRGYSAQELDELKEDRLLHRILDQRDLRIRFAHLVSKRKLYSEMEGLKRRAQSSARNERGYGVHASATVPRPSAKKPRTTYEAVAASVPRSRQPSGSQPGAARSAPMSSVTRDTLATSPRAGASFGGAAHGAHAPRGSGFPHYGRGGPAEALLDYAYDAPPQREAPRSSARSPDRSVLLQQQEIHDLRDRVYTLEIALGLGPGGQAAAQSGKPGSLPLLRGDVDRLSQECGDLHSRVDRRASSYDVDCLRDEVAHLRSEIQNRPSYPGYREPQSYAYSQPYYAEDAIQEQPCSLFTGD
uniref:ATP-binding cassette (ABC) Superfamily n=1 Tax=Phytophthora ramorum TaxID=164328 RepID=H3H855_PHYRM